MQSLQRWWRLVSQATRAIKAQIFQGVLRNLALGVGVSMVFV